jgi:hypothetical protein
MRIVTILLWTFCLVAFLIQAGCEQTQSPGDETTPITVSDSKELSVYLRYAPAMVHILPLTEIIKASDEQDKPKLKVYVSLLDSFGSQIKTPAVFRFEIYEYVQRSSEPKGKRIAIWPDINLTEPSENNKYWRDFLRAYEFNLPFEPESDKSYIVQATCICPNGRRLLAEFTLKHTK